MITTSSFAQPVGNANNLSERPEVAFATWDANDDLVIDRMEYVQGMDRVRAFDYWDSDNDGFIENEEYSSGVRERYDYDGNRVVDRDEWQTKTAWTPNLQGQWDRYDTDADGVVMGEEWNANFSQDPEYYRYDRNQDSRLERSEFYDMSYNYNDLDRNNELNQTEFDTGRPNWVE